jgi:7-cyano-7-deazaguanine synthase
MTKADTIRAGFALGVDYSLTMSCYDPSTDGAACGAGDARLLRRKGFRESGARDPIAYRSTIDT